MKYIYVSIALKMLPVTKTMIIFSNQCYDYNLIMNKDAVALKFHRLFYDIWERLNNASNL